MGPGCIYPRARSVKLCALHCAASPPFEQLAYACLLSLIYTPKRGWDKHAKCEKEQTKDRSPDKGPRAEEEDPGGVAPGWVRNT